ncbi:unnamed protein product, partial [Ectocarpus sp. 6 AP-2014]
SPTALARTGFEPEPTPARTYSAVRAKKKRRPEKRNKTTKCAPTCVRHSLRGQQLVIDAHRAERERGGGSHERRRGTTNECRPINTNEPQHRWPMNEPSQTRLAVV